MREGVVDQGRAVGTRRPADAGELLVARLPEYSRYGLLFGGEDIHAHHTDITCLRPRVARGDRGERDQCRFQGERTEGLTGEPDRPLWRRGGDHRHARGEVPEHLFEPGDVDGTHDDETTDGCSRASESISLVATQSDESSPTLHETVGHQCVDERHATSAINALHGAKELMHRARPFAQHGQYASPCLAVRSLECRLGTRRAGTSWRRSGTTLLIPL